MNKEAIYQAVSISGKCSPLSGFEKHIIDLTIKAIDELVIDEVVKPKPPTPPLPRTVNVGGFDPSQIAFFTGLVLGGLIVGIVLTAIFC